MKRNLLTIIIGAVLIVIFALLLFMFQVRQSETAVVTTFRQAVRQPITEAGCIFQMAMADPESLQIRPAHPEFRGQIQRESHGGQQQPARERLYRLENFRRGDVLSEISPAARCPPRNAKLESMLRSAKSAVIGKHTLSDFVNANPKKLKFDEIENEIEQAVQSQLQHEKLRHRA